MAQNTRLTRTQRWAVSIVHYLPSTNRSGYEAGRSKQAPFPFTREVTVDTIAAAGDKLWKELVGTNVAMKVTSVQLAFTGLESAEVGQRSIEGFLKAGQSAKRPRDEDGNRSGAAESLSNDATDVDAADPANVALALPVTEGDFSIDQPPSFTCVRCSTTISAPVGADSEAVLAALRLEHDDYHFAQDLAKELPDNTHVLSGPSKVSPKKKDVKKRRKGPQSGGIEKFFNRTA